MDGKTVSQLSPGLVLGHTLLTTKIASAMLAVVSSRVPDHHSPSFLNVKGWHNIICGSYDLGYVHSVHRARYKSEYV